MTKTTHVVRKTIECLMVFFIILGCNSVYYKREDNHITLITMFLLAVFAVVELYSLPLGRKAMRSYAAWLMPYLAMVSILAFANVDPDSLDGFFIRYVAFIPLMTLVFVLLRGQGRHNRILYLYSDITAIIAAVSLFFWLFGTILHVIQPTGHMLAYWGGRFDYPSYFGVYFERQIDFISGIYRNQGIFAEAPMFSFNLVFAIAIEIFLKRVSVPPRKGTVVRIGTRKLFAGKVNFRLIILILALFSTFSTTGIILLIAMLYGCVMIRTPKTEAGRKIKYIATVVLAVAVVVSAYYLFRLKSGTWSWAARENDFINGFRGWKSSPILGMGYRDETYVSSNSIFEILLFGGIVLGLIYFFPMVVGILSSLARREKGMLVFNFVLLVNFIFTISGRTFVILMLLSYLNANMILGYSKSRNPQPVRVASCVPYLRNQ